MNKPKVIIIGAGFTGLTCAYYLSGAGFNVEVHEKNPSPGGLIHTHQTPWGLVETAANAVMNSRKFEMLAKDIHLIIGGTKKVARKRYIYRKAPRQWPLSPFETTAMAMKFALSKPRKPKPGETVREWGNRVLGAKATTYLLEPGLQGIYAGDVARMSASLILGRFFNRQAKIKPKVRGSVSPLGGMGELISTVEENLKERGVKFNYGSSYEIKMSSDYQVICTSAVNASALLKDAAPDLSFELKNIEMLPLVTLTAFYPQNWDSIEGFGCLFPRDQRIRALGVLLNHNIFDGRSPHRSETWIYGGAGDTKVLDLDDKSLVEVLAADRERLYKNLDIPLGYKIQRWPQALPHYTTELENLLQRQKPGIKALEKNRIYLMGNYLGSIGLSQILEEASRLPQRLAHG